MYSHIGTEIRSRRLRVGSSNESSAMRETLTERVAVHDEGLRIVKCFFSIEAKASHLLGRKNKSVLIPVPAAAVIRDTQRLIGIIGLKKLLDGHISLW